MEKNVMFKRFLTVFLMVLGLGLTSTLQAQDQAFTPPSKQQEVSEATAMNDIMQEIISLKSTVKNLTPGSTEYTDGIRRIEVFSRAHNILHSGEPVAAAYNVATNYLYNKIEAKIAEASQLVEIEATLFDLTHN